ncbi:tyrosine-type recombinase/integrase [Desulfovibrio sp. OttesenSCG-928-C14]|nr:tyrosine-type recombinase/integrase [Desulfovibrio sp. OttesenSCG-928-C14]
MKQWQLSDLIEAVRSELTSQGVSRERLRKYHYYGFLPISNYFASVGKLEYSPHEALVYVLKVYKEVRGGTKNYRWFMLLRKIVDLLSEYATTGQIIWRRLAPWTTRQLTPPFSDYLTAFGQHLMSQGYQQTTLGGHLPVAKYFLHYLEEQETYEISRITQKDILAYIPAISKRYTRVNGILSRMRIFLAFLHSCGLTRENFVPLLKIRAAARHKYYLGFTKEEQDKLISSIDRNSPHGKRDYALFLLASQTGLRAVDIVGLKFGDIDWHTRELKIVQHKTGRTLILPLSVAVCNSIAEYIINGRAICNSPHIFVRARYPHQELRNRTAHMLVKRAAEKAGITWKAGEHKGFHSFRRAVGSQMLEAEVPLSTISAILGHSTVESSKPYLYTHESGLAMCALTLDGLETKRSELR